MFALLNHFYPLFSRSDQRPRRMGSATVTRLAVALTLTFGAGCAAAQSSASTVTVVEYHNTVGDAYFVTGRAAEQAALDTVAAFRRTGMSFTATAAAAATADQAHVCRLYINLPAAGVSSHYYGTQAMTAQRYDCEDFHVNPPAGFNWEGYDFAVSAPVGGVCANGSTGVSRSFRDVATVNGKVKTSNHRYTVSSTRYAAAAAAGYVGEGVVFCVANASDVPGPNVSGARSTATASLRWLSMVGTSGTGEVRDWFYRVNVATAAENAPDSAGISKGRTFRRERVAGVVREWGGNDNYARLNEMYFDANPPRWHICAPADLRYGSTYDADGKGTYLNCEGDSGNVQLVSVDVSNRSLRWLVSWMRSLPLSYGSQSYAAWGPDPAAVSDTTLLPAGASVVFVTANSTVPSAGYDSRSSNQVAAYSAAAAAGGDARTGGTPVCAASGNTASVVTRLEDMVATSPGSPCLLGVGTQTNAAGTVFGTGPRNEWWTNSTQSIGTTGSNGSNVGVANINAYYSGNTMIRVAFDATGNGVRYYRCQQRMSDSSVRNCDSAGVGSYSISTQGDSRILSLEGQPDADALGYRRTFVERGGKVYLGYVNSLAIDSVSARPNLEATNALFNALGIPILVP